MFGVILDTYRRSTIIIVMKQGRFGQGFVTPFFIRKNIVVTWNEAKNLGEWGLG